MVSSTTTSFPALFGHHVVISSFNELSWGSITLRWGRSISHQAVTALHAGTALFHIRSIALAHGNEFFIHAMVSSTTTSFPALFGHHVVISSFNELSWGSITLRWGRSISHQAVTALHAGTALFHIRSIALAHGNEFF